MTTTSDFCFCRVIGNQLPPKDKSGDRLKSLELVLNQDKYLNVNKIWVLNRIIDPIYLQNVRDLLSDQEIIEIPFHLQDYKKLITFETKLAYLTNINNARNVAIKKCFENFKYAVSLDQDCFFLKDMWDQITEFIRTNDPKLYYGIITKRILSLENIWSEPDNELMLILDNNSTMLFDESILFGKNDKRDLLYKIGFTKSGESQSSQCAICGYVLHIGYDEDIERDVLIRIQMRNLGLSQLIKQADNLLCKKMF